MGINARGSTRSPRELPAITFAQLSIGRAVTVLGQQINLLWIVIGAVLVIFMQAGFALVETGFCRAKHAAHVVATNFAIFGLGFVGYFLVGYAFMFGGASFWRLHARLRPPPRRLADRQRQLGLPVGGRLRPVRRQDHAGRALGFFLYMVAFMDTVATIPTGADGRAVEVEQLRRVGPLLRRHLLPAVRRLDLGRRLAGQDLGHHGPRRRLRRLRRLRRRPRRRRRGRPRRRHRARPRIGKFNADGKARRSRATTSRWRCSARSSCCSAGSASTRRRPSPPPTSSSPRSRPTRPSPVRSAPSRRCS